MRLARSGKAQSGVIEGVPRTRSGSTGRTLPQPATGCARHDPRQRVNNAQLSSSLHFLGTDTVTASAPRPEARRAPTGPVPLAPATAASAGSAHASRAGAVAATRCFGGAPVAARPSEPATRRLGPGGAAGLCGWTQAPKTKLRARSAGLRPRGPPARRRQQRPDGLARIPARGLGPAGGDRSLPVSPTLCHQRALCQHQMETHRPGFACAAATGKAGLGRLLPAGFFEPQARPTRHS